MSTQKSGSGEPREPRDLMAALRASIERVQAEREAVPIRQQSAHGQPPRRFSITRACRRCEADFLALAPGKTGERGLWGEAGWWCSQECYDHGHTDREAAS